MGRLSECEVHDVTHAFERYQRQRGHYPRFSRRGVRVTVLPSYIVVSKKTRDTYIPRETLVPLLRWLIPLVRRMEGSFDPDVAMSEYQAQESFWDEAQRREKRQRR